MYDFYLVKEATEEDNTDILTRIQRELKPDLISLPQPLYSRHLLTHRKLHIFMFEINAPLRSEMLSAGRFYTIKEALKLPTPLFYISISDCITFASQKQINE